MGVQIDPVQRMSEMNRYQKAVTESFRNDGYMNMLTKVGTMQDNSTAWSYASDPFTSDMKLSQLYIGNGLFAKIIDRPAEDAIAKGLDLSDLGEDLEKKVFARLDKLRFNETVITAEKWSRLYGGAIVVALANDGRGLDEPLDWDQVTSVEELIPFERPLIQPDTMEYSYFDDLNRKDRERRFGDPAFYDVYSQNGSFRVHYSRCLIFRNGRLPESANSVIYRHWGIPVYMKVREALRETISSHHDGTKLLERSVLGVYKMKNLSQLLATDEGENKVIQRLQVIDMARNIINSMAIDNDGEDYQYINASMSGASDIIDRTCNMLSAVTDIPQTILFGKDPAGEDATGDNDRDNYFQLLNRIQTNSYHDAAAKVVKLVLKEIVAEGVAEGDIPEYEVRFNPMKQLSEEEQANIDSIKAGTAQTKAATAQVYVDMQALDPSEVRKGLADLNDYQIQGIVENDDLEIPEEAYDLRKQFAELNQIGGEGAENGNAPGEEEMPLGADGGLVNEDGGPGSGNWGHKGRPGIKGGSGPGGGVKYRYNTLQGNVYTSEAKAWAENKKNGGQGANESHVENKKPNIKDAMNSGDSETIKNALSESKEGDQLTIVTSSGKHIGYMKIDDDTWLSLNSGYTQTTEKLQLVAETSPQKFKGQEYDDVDASQWETDKALMDGALNSPGTVEFGMNALCTTGSKYVDKNGNVYVKRADGKWVYKEKDAAKGEILDAENAAVKVMDGTYGAGNWITEAEAKTCLEAATSGMVVTVNDTTGHPEQWEKSGDSFVSKQTGKVKTAEELGGLVASDNAGNDIKEIKSIPTKAAQLATNNTGKMSLVGMTNESDAKDYLKTYGKILSGDDSLQTFGPEIENSWASYNHKTKKALYDYTTGSSYVNEPLHQQKYLSHKGKDAVEDIDLLTKAINGSTIKESTVMYHGLDTNGFCAMFGLSSYDGEKTLNSIIGKVGKDTGFYSCGSSEGSGFQHKAIIIDTLVPAGSKGIYVEPFSYYGNGQKNFGWNGKVTQSSVSQENETILQRNGRYKATGWYAGSDGKTHVIAELVGQYPEQMGADQYEKYCGT